METLLQFYGKIAKSLDIRFDEFLLKAVENGWTVEKETVSYGQDYGNVLLITPKRVTIRTNIRWKFQKEEGYRRIIGYNPPTVEGGKLVFTFQKGKESDGVLDSKNLELVMPELFDLYGRKEAEEFDIPYPVIKEPMTPEGSLWAGHFNFIYEDFSVLEWRLEELKKFFDLLKKMKAQTATPEKTE